MRKRKTVISVAVIALLGVATLVIVLLRGQNHTFPQDFQIEAAARPGGVEKIFMADKENNSVTLSRVSDSLWMVDGQFEANQSLVDLLLRTLADIRIRSAVNKASAENVTKQMAAKSIKVEVYYKDYRINWFGGKVRMFRHTKCEVLYVGHDTQDMMATYMYREGDRAPYIVHIPGFRGCISPRFFIDPYLWRSHSIVNLPVQKIARVELEIPSMPSESFAVAREGDGFTFSLLNPPARVDGFDTARVAQLLSSFVNLNFDEYARVVPKAELDTTFSRAPRTILRITSTDGDMRELKTFLKYSNPDDILAMPDTTMYQVFDLDRLYAVVDNKDTVLIQYFIFDNILQPASFFMGREKTLLAR